jgi:GAF domain-containing protein
MASEALNQGQANLAEVLSDVARSLDAEQGMDEVLQAITASSVATIPGADYAGISLVKAKREIESVAATEDIVRRADQAQEEAGEGPCLDAVWEHDTFRVDDLEDEQRWPNYRARALELGIRSSMSFQLFTDGRNLGALNLYSQQPHAFDEDAEQIGLLFAARAAIALRGEQRETELQKAVRSRDTIGVAKGILMERYKVTDDQAFGMLVRISQHEHIKLLDVAAFLARSGQEPSEAKK